VRWRVPIEPERWRGIEGELDRVIAGEEAIWFNAQKAGLTPTDLFAPFPEETSKPDSIAAITAALEKNIGSLKQSGHNVIFAAIGVRALTDHSESATPQISAGITRLIKAFDRVSPGRGYYGKEKGRTTGNQVELPADGSPQTYESIQQMVDETMGELIASASIRKQGFGGLWHLINHAAAITELDRYGHKRLAQQGLPAHYQHLRLWRSLPDVQDELGPAIKAEHDPREPEYWQGMLKRDEARLTHRIKTLYGFHTLRRLIEDPARKEKADDAFLYLMD